MCFSGCKGKCTSIMLQSFHRRKMYHLVSKMFIKSCASFYSTMIVHLYESKTFCHYHVMWCYNYLQKVVLLHNGHQFTRSCAAAIILNMKWHSVVETNQLTLIVDSSNGGLLWKSFPQPIASLTTCHFTAKQPNAFQWFQTRAQELTAFLYMDKKALHFTKVRSLDAL